MKGAQVQVTLKGGGAPPRLADLTMTKEDPMLQPNDNLFVGDLPPNVSQEQLQAVFGQFVNIVSCKLLPGPQRSAMLIRVASLEEAVMFKESYSGKILPGLQTPVFINYNNKTYSNRDLGKGKEGSPYDGGKGNNAPAGPTATFGGKASDAFGKGKGKVLPNGVRTLKSSLVDGGVLPSGAGQNDDTLFVQGLPPDTTDVDLYHIFSGFGAIPAFGCGALRNEDGSCNGFGFVNFADSLAAATAVMTLNGTQLPDGTMLVVKRKAEQHERRSRWD